MQIQSRSPIPTPTRKPDCTQALDEPASPDVRVTIGNYNVKNWFSPEDADERRGRTPKPQRELDSLARNIRKSGVEVLTMQEVGTSEANVREFFDSHLPGQFPYLAMRQTNDFRGVHVVVASRYPITNVVSHTSTRFPLGDGSGMARFSRDLLRADVDVQGIPLTVYTAHAKSRRIYPRSERSHRSVQNPSNQRIGEEQAAARIIAEEMSQFPGRLYVYNGDLNDGRSDPSLQPLLEPNSGERFFDTLDDRPESECHTWPSSPRRGGGFRAVQFDHILVPESQRGKLIESHIVDIPGVSRQASDHLELVATFNLCA